ncbi:biotin carboxylase [Bacillus ectoiniformans]|uniref:ATP-grasp domain-containing protein n=1 Tax=Bacillus ectoiniformans TaxID=1494429 RepID=UPI001955F6C7|nr:ATP-grasp domain-containing protein [Bacillus ectoiniformans]MBM7650131.1 biotin carboxylase [Bacillus ectoiniformans]
MDTIIFLEANQSGTSRDAIRAASELGLYTVLFTQKKQLLRKRDNFKEVHRMIYINDLHDEQAVQKKITEIKQLGAAILSIISFIDGYVRLAAHYSLPYSHVPFSLPAIGLMEDKICTRKILKDHPANLDFQVIDLQGKNIRVDLPFPFILKSPNSSGSKDVFLINSHDQLQQSILAFKKKTDLLLIEEYADGDQYLIEVLIKDSVPYIMAVIKQTITHEERFIVTGYSISPVYREEFFHKLQKTIISIAAEFQLANGSAHFEMRYSSNGWKLIEINPRPAGGAINRMVEKSTGIQLAKETINLNLGRPLSLRNKRQINIHTAYLTVPKDGVLKKVTGSLKAALSKGVIDVFIKPSEGSKLFKPVSMGHRYGYVMAAGRTVAAAERFAVQAAKEICFHVEEYKGQSAAN